MNDFCLKQGQGFTRPLAVHLNPYVRCWVPPRGFSGKTGKSNCGNSKWNAEITLLCFFVKYKLLIEKVLEKFRYFEVWYKIRVTDWRGLARKRNQASSVQHLSRIVVTQDQYNFRSTFSQFSHYSNSFWILIIAWEFFHVLLNYSDNTLSFPVMRQQFSNVEKHEITHGHSALMTGS